MNRPEYNASNIPAPLKNAVISASLRKWVWVNPETGTPFWLNEETAKAKAAKCGGDLFPPAL